MKKKLDQLLVDRGYFPSRARAQAAILEGVVFADGKRADKAGLIFSPEVKLEVKGELHPYVSRGGVKLEHALKEFKVKVKGKVALDVGASTGGFTDCLLQHGTSRVYALDVGYGQLDWKLRQDPRVKVIERTNVRYFTLKGLGLSTSELGLAVVDVSFISLSKVLPAVYNLLADGAEVIALIKPQFEARREEVGKGGIVREKKVHEEVVEKVKTSAAAIGFKVQGTTRSPIEGADGNVEYFIYLVKG